MHLILGRGRSNEAVSAAEKVRGGMSLDKTDERDGQGKLRWSLCGVLTATKDSGGGISRRAGSKEEITEVQTQKQTCLRASFHEFCSLFYFYVAGWPWGCL